jgi:hypothetical protein
MGQLSRDNEGWRNRMMLESITRSTTQLAYLEEKKSRVMEAGIGEMSDSISHLAWVQQRATEALLGTQYRLSRIQVATNNELQRLNSATQVQGRVLAQVSSVLDELSILLQSVSRNQMEHNNAVKAERILKEVLFQLSEMLANMIIPEDQVGKLLLSRMALEQLEKHGLGTQHLSDLADKRAFADFVKNIRQVVRDIPEEAVADLTTFEIWYKGFDDACQKKFIEYVPGTPRQKKWNSRSFPVFVPSNKPHLSLKKLPDRPQQPWKPTQDDLCRHHSLEMRPPGRPNYELYVPLPTEISNAASLSSQWVPSASKEDTEKRFPSTIFSSVNLKLIGSLIGDIAVAVFVFSSIFALHFVFSGGIFGSLAYAYCYIVGYSHEASLVVWAYSAAVIGITVAIPMFFSEENKAFSSGFKLRCQEYANARRYEQDLRVWSEAVQKWETNRPVREKAFEAGEIAWKEKCAAIESNWKTMCAAVEAENVVLSQQHLNAVQKFDENERIRRDEHHLLFNNHVADEGIRYAVWQESIRLYLSEESVNRGRYLEILEDWLAAFVKQGNKINAFLDDHPDLQLIYCKVDGERQSQRQRELAIKPFAGLLDECEKWRLLSEKEMIISPK